MFFGLLNSLMLSRKSSRQSLQRESFLLFFESCIRSRWLDIGLVLSSSSRSIQKQKNNFANIQPSSAFWPHAWSITFMYNSMVRPFTDRLITLAYRRQGIVVFYTKKDYPDKYFFCWSFRKWRRYCQIFSLTGNWDFSHVHGFISFTYLF